MNEDKIFKYFTKHQSIYYDKKTNKVVFQIDCPDNEYPSLKKGTFMKFAKAIERLKAQLKNGKKTYSN